MTSISIDIIEILNAIPIGILAQFYTNAPDGLVIEDGRITDIEENY